MKSSRRHVIALLFVCVLALSAFAAVALATEAEQAGHATTETVQGGEQPAAAGEQVAHEVAADAKHEVAEHQEGGEAHGVPWWNFIFRVVNFVLVLSILWWAAGKKIVGFFGGRRRQIKEDLDDLSARQAEAQKKLKDVERSIANLEQEKQAILDQAKTQGEALKAAIIAKAGHDAEAITAQAKRTAENEAKAALDKMRGEMAELVVEAAQKLVKSKLTEKDHDKLVDDYLTKVVLN